MDNELKRALEEALKMIKFGGVLNPAELDKVRNLRKEVRAMIAESGLNDTQQRLATAFYERLGAAMIAFVDGLIGTGIDAADAKKIVPVGAAAFVKSVEGSMAALDQMIADREGGEARRAREAADEIERRAFEVGRRNRRDETDETPPMN